METIKELFEQAVLASPTPKAETIDVTFKNGSDGTFTKRFLNEMMTDPMVSRIIDNATGEIIYLA